MMMLIVMIVMMMMMIMIFREQCGQTIVVQYGQAVRYKLHHHQHLYIIIIAIVPSSSSPSSSSSGGDLIKRENQRDMCPKHETTWDDSCHQQIGGNMMMMSMVMLMVVMLMIWRWWRWWWWWWECQWWWWWWYDDDDEYDDDNDDDNVNADDDEYGYCYSWWMMIWMDLYISSHHVLHVTYCLLWHFYTGDIRLKYLFLQFPDGYDYTDRNGFPYFKYKKNVVSTDNSTGSGVNSSGIAPPSKTKSVWVTDRLINSRLRYNMNEW